MSVFTKPYPKDSTILRKVITAILFGNFIFLFLFLFQPFGLHEWQVSNKALRLLGYGGITTFVVLFNSVVVELIFKKWFDEKNWKVWKEMVWALWHILLIGTANLIYSHYQIGFALSFRNFLAYQWITVTIGVIPVVIITLLHYNRLTRKNLQEAKHITDVIEHEPLKNTTPEHAALVTLAGDQTKEEIKLDPLSILYIESADNYVNIVWLENGAVKRTLLRNTLKNLEDKLEAYTFLYRCHRSYMVNLQRVVKVSGNSQGYKLHLSHTEDLVPVSRSLNEIIRERIEALHTH